MNLSGAKAVSAGARELTLDSSTFLPLSLVSTWTVYVRSCHVRDIYPHTIPQSLFCGSFKRMGSPQTDSGPPRHDKKSFAAGPWRTGQGIKKQVVSPSCGIRSACQLQNGTASPRAVQVGWTRCSPGWSQRWGHLLLMWGRFWVLGLTEAIPLPSCDIVLYRHWAAPFQRQKPARSGQCLPACFSEDPHLVVRASVDQTKAVTVGVVAFCTETRPLNPVSADC